MPLYFENYWTEFYCNGGYKKKSNDKYNLKENVYVYTHTQNISEDANRRY